MKRKGLRKFRKRFIASGLPSNPSFCETQTRLQAAQRR